MALNRKILVPMPKNKVVFAKRINSDIYDVRYLISSVRKGKTSNNKRVNIGIRDEVTGKLIPNNNYFNIFKEDAIVEYTPKSVKNYGNYFLIYKLVSSIGLLDTLKIVFPNSWDKIINIAFYMVCEGSVMYYCEDFCDDTYTFNNCYLPSSTISNLLSSINIDKRVDFFKEWVKRRPENECIIYDSTSISTYGKDITIAEYGYNKDGESLPQINLGLFYGKVSRLPLFYEAYNGSLKDKEQFECMMRYAKTFNINKVSYVMDRGYFKRVNIEYLYKEQIPFIMGVQLNLVDIKNVFDELKHNIKNSINSCDIEGIYGVNKEMELFKVPVKLHLYFNYKKEHDEVVRIDNDVKRLEQELKSKKTLEDISKYERYFSISLNNDRTFTYSKNYSNIDKEKSTCGYFALITSRIDYTTSGVLSEYRSKDLGEKQFNNFKNFIDMNRLRIHSDETMNGKIFIGFISIIIKSQLEKLYKNELNRFEYSIEKILKELSKIKIVTLHSKDTLMLPLTKKQKDIFKIFEISEETIKESLFQMHI